MYMTSKLNLMILDIIDEVISNWDTKHSKITVESFRHKKNCLVIMKIRNWSEKHHFLKSAISIQPSNFCNLDKLRTLFSHFETYSRKSTFYWPQDTTLSNIKQVFTEFLFTIYINLKITVTFHKYYLFETNKTLNLSHWPYSMHLHFSTFIISTFFQSICFTFSPSDIANSCQPIATSQA